MILRSRRIILLPLKILKIRSFMEWKSFSRAIFENPYYPQQIKARQIEVQSFLQQNPF